MELRYGPINIAVTKKTYDASKNFTAWRKGASSASLFEGQFGAAGSVIMANIDRTSVPTLTVQYVNGNGPTSVDLLPRKSFFIASALSFAATHSNTLASVADSICANMDITSAIVGRLLGISETFPASNFMINSDTPRLIFVLNEDKSLGNITRVPYFVSDKNALTDLLYDVRELAKSIPTVDLFLATMVLDKSLSLSEVPNRNLEGVVSKLDDLRKAYYSRYHEPSPDSAKIYDVFLGSCVSATLIERIS